VKNKKKKKKKKKKPQQQNLVKLNKVVLLDREKRFAYVWQTFTTTYSMSRCMLAGCPVAATLALRGFKGCGDERVVLVTH